MTLAVHYANYQGIPCKAAEFRRSDGLSPESGFVVVDYADLKKLEFKEDAHPWRGTSESNEDPGGISIHVWHKLKGTATIADSPRPFQPASSGLRLYGPLVLTTVMSEGGDGDSITYSDIYVANSDEVLEDLAEARLHKTGEIRVDLTDIRQFYGRYGGLIGRINCHLRNGRFDPTTVKTPGRRRNGGTTTAEELNGVPWSFTEVVSYLFSQLPGSPRVIFDKGVEKMKAPEEIDQIGAPIHSVIQGLLENYRLVPKMTPHGNYWLCRRNTKLLQPGQVFTGLDRKSIGSPPFISTEKKSVAYVDVPSMVLVLGRPRVRRRTEPYVPVFQDLDGHTYKLEEIDKVWPGYALLHVRLQATKGTEKNFADVPPRPPRRKLNDADREATIRDDPRDARVRGTPDFESTRDLHYRRRDIMRRQAYRLYAPLALFNKSGSKSKLGAVQMMDPDSDWIEFLPMGPAPFPASALAKDIELGLEMPRKKLGEIVLHPPIVRAYRLGSVLEIDPNAAVRLLDDAIADEKKWVEFWERKVQEKKKELVEAVGPASKAEDELKKAPTLSEAKFLGFDTGRLSPGGSIPFSLSATRKAMDDVARAIRTSNAAKDKVEFIRSGIAGYERSLAESNAKLNNWRDRRGAVLLAIREEGGIHVAQSQLPYGVVPQNGYSLDLETGLLSLEDFACIIDPPILHDPNSGIVIGDGHVTVTFGFESHWNEPSDYTTVLLSRGERGGVRVAGVSAASPVKPQIVQDPELVMFEDERGIPMNLEECIDQAGKKAAHKLEGSRTAEGYANQFGGFVKAILGPGVDSVQHVWGGDDAHTHVAVNAPGWIGPAGPAVVPKVTDPSSASRQSSKRAEGGVA
jgi:hypothetical protein